MQLYLPIAEIPVDPFVVVIMGAAVGFLSGMFGVGGGFLMTPLLIFYGIPPAVAVGTEASQIVASSVSGVLAHLKRKTVDFKMGGFLVAGGAAGSVIGILIFRALRQSGQVETLISISYVLFLGIIGGLMMVESVRTLLRSPDKKRKRRKRRSPAWMASLPFATRFRASGLYISPIPPIVLGACVGMLAAIMGVGGGFIMVPAMLYILNMPTNVVVGTSLFQIIFVTAITTVLHAAANQTVDIVLALLLLTGGVIGAQLGARAGVKLKAEHLRALLALIVLAVCARLLIDLALPPASPYIVEAL
ncbi:sulfite exporter TauE/SafE family protein [Hyphococcus flavus]|uniref:Probable membrane transporter protein n=1 Tax=Hyphococcus flavus TaxID=1866326 RepID=A0AAF0CDV3_9PROT|nr:sulfite exporter TauE/SafE family protein [Hyphococcus flavus]WDI30311.1 sulfite exporter TauE/SafE family protein [Hyphococcus flavus]